MARSRLGDKGRLTIPGEVRHEVGIERGDAVDVRVIQGRIVVTPLKSVDPAESWFWDQDWQAGEVEASDDIYANRVEVFESEAAFLAALESVPLPVGDDADRRAKPARRAAG